MGEYKTSQLNGHVGSLSRFVIWVVQCDSVKTRPRRANDTHAAR
jgi:hypothetical protein